MNTNSYGVNRSDGVNGSYGVNRSDGVNLSYGVNRSYGVNLSYGVNRSYGVNLSDGVNGSYGVNRSYGILNSFGVDRAIFLADKKRTFSIFGTEVSEKRFDEVWEKLHENLRGWYPKFNNAFELYVQNGNNWKKVDASEIISTLSDDEKPYEAWKDMPQQAVDYVASLPEFDPAMFEKITGIDVKKDSFIGEEVEVKIKGKSYKAKIIE